MFSPKRPVDESLLGFVMQDPDSGPWQAKAVARCESHIDAIRRSEGIEAMVVSIHGSPEVVVFTPTQAIGVSKAGIGTRMGIQEIAEVKRIPTGSGGYALLLVSPEWLRSEGTSGKTIELLIASGRGLDGVHAIIGGLQVLHQQAQETPDQSTTGTPASSSDIAEKLAALAELRASGALTDAEFADAKAAVLGGT